MRTYFEVILLCFVLCNRYHCSPLILDEELVCVFTNVQITPRLLFMEMGSAAVCAFATPRWCAEEINRKDAYE